MLQPYLESGAPITVLASSSCPLTAFDSISSYQRRGNEEHCEDQDTVWPHAAVRLGAGAGAEAEAGAEAGFLLFLLSVAMGMVEGLLMTGKSVLSKPCQKCPPF